MVEWIKIVFFWICGIGTTNFWLFRFYHTHTHTKKKIENEAPNKLQCSDVVLFWRMNHLLQSSGNMLRLEAAGMCFRLSFVIVLC